MTSRSLRSARGAAAALLAAGLLTPPAAAEESLGMTLGTGLANLVYLPAKVAYAAGGTVVGGLAYVFSGGRSEVASQVVEPSLRGDYVLTPDHLRGERPIVFVGRDAGAAEPAALASAEVPPEDVWTEAPETQWNQEPWPEEGGSGDRWADEWGGEARWEEAEIAPSTPPAAEAPDAEADEDDFWNPREPEPAPRAAPRDPPPAEARPRPGADPGARPAPDWDRRAPVRVEELPPVASPPPRVRPPAASAPPSPPPETGPPPVWVYEPRHRDGGR